MNPNKKNRRLGRNLSDLRQYKSATCGVVLLSALAWQILPAHAYTILISNDLSGDDFYNTNTLGSGEYDRYTAGTLTVRVPPAADFARSPTTLSIQLHPIKGRSGNPGKLFNAGNVLAASEGATGFSITLGTATQALNIGGTFKVVPEGNEANTGFVNLLAKGMLDGQIGVGLQTFAGPPSASYNSSIFIEHLGTATATASSAGTQSETIGVEATLSKEPGVTGKAERSVQVSTSGTSPQNFFMLGKVPVNTPINWNFTMTLQAMNTENVLGGRSAAWSWAVQQFVNLTPQGERHTLKREDPFFSESVFTFDAASGALNVLHPNAVLGFREGEAIVEDDGTLGRTPSTEYSGFRPEVEAILQYGKFSETDSLLHSLLRYSGIYLDHANPDGTFAFTDGILEFLDPLDVSNILASTRLTDIVADPSTGMFSARVSDFQFDSLSPGSSPLGVSFSRRGGEMWFDPSIIFDSNLFTQSATSSPYTVDGNPTIPLPAAAWMGLSLLSGTAAVSKLRRKLRNRPPDPRN